MIRNIYTLHDQVAQTWMTPFHSNNDGEAIRTFIDWCKNPELPLHNHREDYILFHLGFFDTDTGTIELVTPPAMILKGSSVKKDEPQANQAKLKEVVNNG